ncbi:hypothetical protein H3S93_08300 [Bifidobacterium sp. W8109]|uniref:Jag family protein n=1 Tax=Bifidobacterium TaxID=1678 RepID=UPI00028B6EEF|nr:r3H domain-containing protein [Bifidobacterium asteroides PRL2011]MBH9972303.1 hypothetical protein [Bifidobacterium asteroides]MBI0073949.1 hypothetical protein [Bifidobacterium sp. W8110]
MSQSLDQGKTIEQLNEEADVAADYLEGLLDIVDYEGDIEMGVRNHRPTVQIVADDDTDIKHLIGKDGEVVDALQQLTRLAVQQKIGERSHLIVDVDGFLRRKREHLREQALDVIDEVRETGDPVNMKPMNSFERKIVHDMVREEGLKSRSHGEEPHRYVTVYLKARSEDEDLPDDAEDEPVGYDAPLDADETDQADDSVDYTDDGDSMDTDME